MGIPDDLHDALQRAYGVPLDSKVAGLIHFARTVSFRSWGPSLPISFDELEGPALRALGRRGGQGPRLVPVEVLPLANNGGGGHLGLLVHAPELRSVEVPLVVYDMEASPSTWALGATFRDGIARLIAEQRSATYTSGYEGEDEDQRMAHLEALAAYLDVGAPNGPPPPRPFVPATPRGWRFVPTRDGVGVLAPKSQFDAIGPRHDPFHVGTQEGFDVRDAIARARDALRRNQAGTALGILRELHHAHFGHNLLAASYELLMSAYRSLGRPSFAKRLEAQLP